MPELRLHIAPPEVDTARLLPRVRTRPKRVVRVLVPDKTHDDAGLTPTQNATGRPVEATSTVAFV